MAQPDIDIEVWAEEEYTLPNANTLSKIRPIDDLWTKGYDLGEKPDCQAWNYVWNMITVWLQYIEEEEIPGLSDLFLTKANNLSDLSDLSEARDNLSVYSIDEADDTFLQLVGGTLSGGLKITGSSNVVNTTTGLSITSSSGVATFTSNAAGFSFKTVNSAGTSTTGTLTLSASGALVTSSTITASGSIVSSSTVRGATLQSTGSATVSGTTTTGNLVVSNASATVNGSNIVRSVNGSTANSAGAVTISLSSYLTGIRLGPIQSFKEREGNERMTGGVMTAWADFGSSNYWVYLRPLQYLINGSWVTVAYT